jgi:hypothetical protein
LVYTARWEVLGETFRDVFAPTLGELKPDRDYVRALLAKENALVLHTDVPLCTLDAHECSHCRLNKLVELAKSLGAVYEDALAGTGGKTVRRVRTRTRSASRSSGSSEETLCGDAAEDAFKKLLEM